MRILITADLHYNHPRSTPLAKELIAQMNRAGGDVLLVVGDTAVADGDALERCLEQFEFAGPKLFLAGNHELWTQGPDSIELFTESLPRRVRELGWRWLETEPFVADEFAIVGSVGWYDYSFAQPELNIARRFYERKVSPGAAERLGLDIDMTDVAPNALQIIARWNDGKFVKLGRSDDRFLGECINRLRDALDGLHAKRQVIAAVHHLPFAELLPPGRSAQWDFAKAYLGSGKIGDLLLKYPNVSHVFCGHSHFAAEARVGHIHAINVGSGYRAKRYTFLDV